MAALDYIKHKEKEKEEKKMFELVLVDIESSFTSNIKCVKKNMYEQNLKYIAISYRWGELQEQLVRTPDYIAHIKSFDIFDFFLLYFNIKREPDLKEIRYLWIDAISVDQYNNDEKKKETILHMTEIYKRATYILAVPDLHKEYLRSNPGSQHAIYLMEKHKKILYQSILNYQTTNESENNNKLKKKAHGLLNYLRNVFQSTKQEEINIAYGFLIYLIRDWADRAWVISEYHIAKLKQEIQGTPLKLMFISLLGVHVSYFISYDFEYYNSYLNKNKDSDEDNDIYISCMGTNISSHFPLYLKKTLIQRSHLEMLLDSHASKNEDRFHAILPSWEKYSHCIEDGNTISNWRITDMTSVILKLYEIMDDLWDKARLLHACSRSSNSPIPPSFASQTNTIYLRLTEKDYPKIAYEKYLSDLEECVFEKFGNNNSIQQFILDGNNDNENIKSLSSSLYTENLINIQLNREFNCLSVEAKKCFTFKIEELDYDQEDLLPYSLKLDDDLIYLYLPFFTFAVPEFIQTPPWSGTGIVLIGNMNQNRWVITFSRLPFDIPEKWTCYSDGFILNIY